MNLYLVDILETICCIKCRYLSLIFQYIYYNHIIQRLSPLSFVCNWNFNNPKYRKVFQQSSLYDHRSFFLKTVLNNIWAVNIPSPALYAGYIPHKRLPNWITSPNLPLLPSNIFVYIISTSFLHHFLDLRNRRFRFPRFDVWTRPPSVPFWFVPQEKGLMWQPPWGWKNMG